MISYLLIGVVIAIYAMAHMQSLRAATGKTTEEVKAYCPPHAWAYDETKKMRCSRCLVRPG